MRSIFTFTIAVLILTACSQTPTSATLTPLSSTTPTSISTVTPTFSPTFTSTPQVAEPLPDLTPAQLADMTTEQKLAAAPDENGFTKTISGVYVIYTDEAGLEKDTAYNLTTGEWESAPEIKEYPICAPKDFLSNPIDVNDFYDGTFDAWAATQAKPFTVDQLDTRPWVVTGLGILIPDPTIDRVPGTITMHKDITCGVVEMDGIRYRMLPIELPDPSDPTNPDENIRVNGFEIMNYVKNGQLGKEVSIDILDKHSNQWWGMMVPAFMTDYHYLNTPVEIPLAKKTWDALGAEKMADIFERVRKGEITALRELNGMPVMINISDSPWYK